MNRKIQGNYFPRYIVLLLFLCTLQTAAQNIQLHYDMGKGRGYLTSTVEMFSPDKYGSTFFFVDMDYNSVPGAQGVTMAYWEIARALRFWKSPVAFHTEYNGGFGQWIAGNERGAYQIENAFLNGVEYAWDSENLSRGFTLQVLHKYIQGKHDFSFQLTGVWYINLAGGKVTLAGFADFWREDLLYGDITTRYCFNAEPQFWYNFNSHFALGGEAEIDSNFGGQKGLHVYPTVGAKYTL